MMKHASLGARVGALVLASICLATAGYGVVYAAFALDYDTLEAARTGNRPVEAMGFWRRPPDVKPVLSPWADRAGMGGAARRRIALDSDTPQDAAERLVDVTKALQQEPTSGWLWLEYTALCLELPFCRDKASPAYALIEITARREGLIRREEVFMLLKHWERMAPDVQAHAATVFNDVMPLAGREGEARFKDLFSQKPDEVRDRIKAAVLSDAGGKLQHWQKQVWK